VQSDKLGAQNRVTAAAVDPVDDVSDARAAVAEQEQRHDDQKRRVLRLADACVGVVLVAVNSRVILRGL